MSQLQKLHSQAGWRKKFAATLTATTFTLEAKPKGTMENDKCGTLGVTNTGARKSSKLTAAECWK